MASLPTARLTEEQYLQIKRDALDKSEFYDGQMFAMPHATANHSVRAATIGALLHDQMPRGCRTFDAGLRIKVAATGLVTYADCSVICGEPQCAGDQRDVVLNSAGRRDPVATK